MTAHSQYVFEADKTKATVELIAAHVGADRDTAQALIVALAEHDELFDALYAIAAGFAQAVRPGRRRDATYVNAGSGRVDERSDTDADLEIGVAVNAIIAAAANRDRVGAQGVWASLALGEQIRATRFALDLITKAFGEALIGRS